MSVEYFNPNFFPYDADNLGAIIGMTDGQLRTVVQENGINAGAPVFIPPKALVDGTGVFTGVPAELNGIDQNSILSLSAAKKSDGTLIFTDAMAELLLQYMHGIAYVKSDKTPPPTKTGWYDKNSPSAGGALNLTFYGVGQSVSIARDNIVAVQMGAALSAQVGDLIIAAYALTTDFEKCAPLLTRRSDLTKSTDAGNDLTLDEAMVVEVESVTQNGGAVDEWVEGQSYISPDRAAANPQVFNLNSGTQAVDIYYKTFDLGLPLELANRIVLGKCVASDGTNGGVIALEVW